MGKRELPNVQKLRMMPMLSMSGKSFMMLVKKRKYLNLNLRKGFTQRNLTFQELRMVTSIQVSGYSIEL